MKKHFIAASLLLTSFVQAKGDLDAYSVTVNDRSPDPGDLVTVRWTAINRTGDYIKNSQQGVMFSTNSTIARGDTLLGREYVGALGGWLADSTKETKVVTIPSWAVPGTKYWIGIYADYDRQRSESDEGNNNSGGVSITIRGADLIAQSVSMADNFAAHELGFTYDEFEAYPQENVYVASVVFGIENAEYFPLPNVTELSLVRFFSY